MTSTAVAPIKVNLPSLQMDEAELIRVLSNSLYPGAKPESIKLVIGYCKAAGLNPMQKPVHIVPMKVKQKNGQGKDEYVERDVIMPGIGHYRIQAARSNEYGGMSEPEFGPMVKMDFTDEVWEDGPNGNRHKVKKPGTIEYPESCRITVKRIVGDRVVEFTATEYWIENYATAGNWTSAPNAMWKKRPRGQLAKCTAAQALRMAFPELGAQPTADELEGKTLDTTEGVVIEAEPIQQPGRKSEAAKPAAAVEPEKKPDEKTPEPPPAGDEAKLSAGMKKTLRARMEGAKVADEKFKEKFGVAVDDLPASLVNHALAWVQEMKEAASEG
jgi:phage recombination protein Bet